MSTVSTNGIPAAALAAYQRAAQVIGSADPACHIEWPLLAAIGQVESDHGRYGGNLLSAQGVSTPGIYGSTLDGAAGTARVPDTDAGLYDNDTRFDRAVGPMQFIPSTWQMVGVDGDGDKIRNPQDIDDAALASAVYLCSGDGDLSTRAGLDSAVYRYNHSTSYVRLVRSIAAAYADGGYSAVPTNSYAPVAFGPSDDVADATRPHPAPAKGPEPTKDPDKGSAPVRPPTEPAPEAGEGDGDEGGKDPAPSLAEQLTKTPEAVEPAVSELEKAAAFCAASTQAELNLLGGLQACANAYLEGGAHAVSLLLASLSLGGLFKP